MTQDLLTLEEAARTLKRSTQTIRRMIKKGELQAQRIKTPQGFHYTVRREHVQSLLEWTVPEGEEPEIEEPENMFSNSPIQNADFAESTAEKTVLINQNQIPTNQTPFEPIQEPVNSSSDKMEQKVVYYFPPLPPSPSVNNDALLKLLERQHREHMGLIRLVEQLQSTLHAQVEHQKPQAHATKGRLKRFLSWLQGN